MKTTEEYLKDPNHCPFCDGDKLMVMRPQHTATPNVVKAEVRCYGCGKSYDELYKLIGIEEQ